MLVIIRLFWLKHYCSRLSRIESIERLFLVGDLVIHLVQDIFNLNQYFFLIA